MNFKHWTHNLYIFQIQFASFRKVSVQLLDMSHSQLIPYAIISWYAHTNSNRVMTLAVVGMYIGLLTCIHRLVTQTQSHIYAHYDIIHPQTLFPTKPNDHMTRQECHTPTHTIKSDTHTVSHDYHSLLSQRSLSCPTS